MTAPNVTAPVVGGKITAAGFGTEVDNAVASLINPPRVSVYNAGNQNVGTTYGRLTWDSEHFDTDTMHDTGSNTGRLTCVHDGYYQVTIHLNMTDATSVDYTQAALYKNGSLIHESYRQYVSTTGTYTIELTKLVALVAGDYLEAFSRRQTGGSNSSVTGGTTQSYFQAYLVAWS